MFDGVGTNNPLSRLQIEYARGFNPPSTYDTIDEALKKINLKESDKITSIFRVQSDFQGEVADTYLPKMKRDFAAAIGTIENTDRLPFININNAKRSYSQNITDQLKGINAQSRMLSRNLKPAFVKAISNGDTDALKKILGDDLYRAFTDNTLAERIPGKFFAPNEAFDVGNTGRSVSFTEFVDDVISKNPRISKDTVINYIFNKTSGDVLEAIGDLGAAQEATPVIETIFKQRKSIDAINKKIIGKSANSRGGFIDPAQQKIIMQKLKGYNDYVDAVNDGIARGADKEAVDKIIDKLNKNVLDEGIDKLSISPREIERITGKPFSQSLDKTPEEIFYMLDESGSKQKYIDVPNNPGDLAKAYFDDIADEGKTFFELANGVKVLKKAVGVNAKDFGMKIDPYFDGGQSKYMKLPVRARVLAAVKGGQDGIHIGNKQAITEQAEDYDVIMKNYKSGENELQKILDELIPSRKQQKGMISKIEGTDTEFDGTYLKFTDEFKKAVAEKGIDAFKLGGPVDIDKMLAEL